MLSKYLRNNKIRICLHYLSSTNIFPYKTDLTSSVCIKKKNRYTYLTFQYIFQALLKEKTVVAKSKSVLPSVILFFGQSRAQHM